PMTKRPLVVHKFGGTSLGDGERIVRAADLLCVAARTARVVGVASAMSGITDLLLAAARDAERGKIRTARRGVAHIAERHEHAVHELGRLTGLAADFDRGLLEERD